MKLLFQTNDPTIIAFAQVLLDGEGIASFVLDVHTSIMEGGIGLLPRRVMVADDDFDDAIVVMTDNDIEVVK